MAERSDRQERIAKELKGMMDGNPEVAEEIAGLLLEELFTRVHRRLDRLENSLVSAGVVGDLCFVPREMTSKEMKSDA